MNCNIALRWLAPAAALCLGPRQSPESRPVDAAWRPDPAVESALRSITAADVEKTIAALVACGTRHSASESESGGRGVGAARRFLAAELNAISKAAGGRLEVREEWVDLVSPTRLPGGKARGANVIARLPGTLEPQRVVLVSGHYDSINSKFDSRRGGIDPEGDAPGADDDASGTAVAVECARALATLQFPMTIEFCAFTAEEQGLLGSRAHAKALKDAGADVVLAVSNDIVGASVGEDGVRRDDFVRVFSSCPTGLDSPSRNAARHAVDVAHVYFGPAFRAVPVFRADRYQRGGDHTSFEAEGFPGIRFTEPRENYDHQHQDVRAEKGREYGDLQKHTDAEYIARVARLNAALLAELASAPPPVDVRVNGALRHDTAVTLAAPAEAWAKALRGFEVVVRATTAPLWEQSYYFDSGSRAAAPVVLDDCVVGVRAISANGRRSAAVVPPERNAPPDFSGNASRPAR